MRSTSGITCCHFFCSQVFSMPVWRYPIVGDTETTVSPSSSNTNRNTPWVLGCCGPMFTVIVSVRTSAIEILVYQFAKHVQHRHVHFLRARRSLFRDVDVNRRQPASLAAIATGETTRD